MIEFLRKYKFTYAFYNLFKYKLLKHNIPLYKKYGLRKYYFSSISSADFAGRTEFINADLSKLLKDPLLQDLSSENQESIRNFDNQGFIILKQYLSSETVNDINSEIDHLLQTKKAKMRYQGRKLMFAIHKSKKVKEVGEDPTLQRILDRLLDGEAHLFQSINFVQSGSEQKTHSDSVHMTTYPYGGLLGVWFALEDIDETNGPLHYYPGSHKLPYYLNSAFDNEGTKFRLGDKNYDAYEEMIAQKMQNQQLKKKIFKAKKGDVLIWHANLFHGGEAHLDPNRSRKSMVFHYFKKGAICYHEISQRPALMDI